MTQAGTRHTLFWLGCLLGSAGACDLSPKSQLSNVQGAQACSSLPAQLDISEEDFSW